MGRREHCEYQMTIKGLRSLLPVLTRSLDLPDSVVCKAKADQERGNIACDWVGKEADCPLRALAFAFQRNERRS